MKILSQEESKLLERKNLVLEVDHTLKSTPKKDLIKDEIAKFLKVEEKLLVIKHVYTGFGKSSSKVEVYVYDNEKALKEVEPKKKDKTAKTEEKK